MFYSIGHSTHTIEHVAKCLQAADVNILADIRSFPYSRWCPQWNKNVCGDALAEYGIAYLHLRDLGGRRNKRHVDVDNTFWRLAAFRNYADYMNDPKFKAAFSILEKLNAGNEKLDSKVEKLTDENEKLRGIRNIGFMCTEYTHYKCHRTIVSDALVAATHLVMHIESDGSHTQHVLRPEIRIIDGVVTYPGKYHDVLTLS